jgi:hypothetical protein
MSQDRSAPGDDRHRDMAGRAGHTVLLANHDLPGGSGGCDSRWNDRSEVPRANTDLYSGPAWASPYAFASLAKTLKALTAASVLSALKKP